MKISVSIPMGRNDRSPIRAFTLLEVMIAVGIFFAAIFTILELTSRNLKMAQALRVVVVDPANLASELTMTNKLTEGSTEGDFGDLYPGVKWVQNVALASTNGLYQVDFSVFQPVNGKLSESKLSILLYRPESTAGAGGGSTLGGASAGRSSSGGRTR